MAEDGNIRLLRQIRAIRQNYELRIKNLEDKFNLIIEGKNEQIKIYQEEIKELREIIKLHASRPVYFYNQTKAISDSKTLNENIDQSRNVEISGGTVNASGAGAFASGDISGTVANTINQLPTSSNPEKPEIKELLHDLENAIAISEDLDNKRKTKALKQIEVLAKAAKNPTDEDMRESAEDAITMLEGIFSKLPATTVGQELLPAIASFFGL